MGIVTKPNTFTGQTAPQLPWLDSDLDLIYSEFNGNIEDANIKTNAAIAQAKILGLVTDLAAKLGTVGGTMTGALLLRLATPYLRLIGTETSAVDWRFVENAGFLLFQQNTGSEGTPTWTTRYSLPAGSGGPAAVTDLTTKTYVDTAVATISALAFSKVVKADSNVSCSSTTFEDVTGLVATVTTGARRVRVSFIGSGSATGSSQRTLYVNLQIDGVDAGGTDGMTQIETNNTGRPGNLSFSFVSDVLTAGVHTLKIQIKIDNNTCLLYASAASKAFLIVEEIPTTN
jgi:hypothetical protein